MNIIRATYANPKNDVVTVEMNTGYVAHLPYPCDNFHDEYLQEFLNNGGVIDPYVETEPHEKSPSAGRAKKNKAAQTRGD